MIVKGQESYFTDFSFCHFHSDLRQQKQLIWPVKTRSSMRNRGKSVSSDKKQTSGQEAPKGDSLYVSIKMLVLVKETKKRKA